MDTSRLPSYRSSYLLRFHPYPRMKLSTREMILAAIDETPQDVVTGADVGLSPTDTEYLEPATILHEAIHSGSSDSVPRLIQRRLSLSTLVVDLALMTIKGSSLEESGPLHSKQLSNESSTKTKGFTCHSPSFEA